MRKLRPNDIVTVVAIASELVAILLFLLQIWLLGAIYCFASVVAIVFLNHNLNGIYKKGSTIRWLDYLRIRDLMAHGHNYEAVIYTMKVAYGMDEAQIQALKPEDLNTLMEKLKVNKENV
jgi:hypothetical protein